MFRTLYNYKGDTNGQLIFNLSFTIITRWNVDKFFLLCAMANDDIVLCLILLFIEFIFINLDSRERRAPGAAV